ncbi:thiamine phosphate synthase [Curtobacterium flaccumfaciens pv. poinsettiae]|uniref:thiamine phosphate synthase n=1 Tax=Curtobacterium poinsettiae TaxID=159612 RepID=UPI0021CAD30D|nr:thiamine phosphate synthase [Curtobacterium flaccumfaciens]MCU0154492.1 thiamine phosphate synthase [Curtobacterium flaccumfaciens pv. poinsettiae]
MHPTATKADHPPALGHDGFARLAAATDVPCVAIGGVTLDDVVPLRAAGAAGVAIVSGICAAADPGSAAAAYVAAWGPGTGHGAEAGRLAEGAPVLPVFTRRGADA